MFSQRCLNPRPCCGGDLSVCGKSPTDRTKFRQPPRERYESPRKRSFQHILLNAHFPFPVSKGCSEHANPGTAPEIKSVGVPECSNGYQPALQNVAHGGQCNDANNAARPRLSGNSSDKLNDFSRPARQRGVSPAEATPGLPYTQEQPIHCVNDNDQGFLRFIRTKRKHSLTPEEEVLQPLVLCYCLPTRCRCLSILASSEALEPKGCL